MIYKKNSANPLCTILQLVGAKWKLLIIQQLFEKDMRFCELKKKLGCTAKVLVSCLKELESDGFIVREKLNNSDSNIRYYLTDLGYTLRPVLDAMQKWGRDYKKLIKLMKLAESEDKT